VVVARGGSITTPMVACLTDVLGRPLPRPERVDTSARGRGVAFAVGEKSVPKQLPMDRLLAALVA
jgi:hypothetical protein